MRWLDLTAYTRREWDGLTIKSEGYVGILGEAERSGETCIWVHTHPGLGALPTPSEHDRIVDEEIADVFRIRSGSPYYGALIFSSGPGGLAFTGYLDPLGQAPKRIHRMWVVGDRWRLCRSFDSPAPRAAEMFDRNVRAFGAAIQDTLAELRIGVVGCGGTGSAVAEQLVRLGVRQLVLIDPDLLSTSNLTRVYGSTPGDVDTPKVEALGRHLRAIAPDLRCQPVRSMITLEPTARSLVGCDMLFGCTDDNAGRLVLSRLATYLLTQVIDCGVLLSSDREGNLTGIDGRVTVLSAGQACLVCRGRVDLARAMSELLTPDERVRREREGYAPALGRIEPAVVSFTTLVASTAVGELLERLIGYGPLPRPSELLLRIHEREISTNVAAPQPRHYCDPAAGKIGAGVTEPFLEQTWPK
jgi:hypothetical protein